jgi:hypothetical protein
MRTNGSALPSAGAEQKDRAPETQRLKEKIAAKQTSIEKSELDQWIEHETGPRSARMKPKRESLLA